MGDVTRWSHTAWVTPRGMGEVTRWRSRGMGDVTVGTKTLHVVAGDANSPLCIC